MLSRYRHSLIALFEKVHALKEDRWGKRHLALEIQEEVLLRVVRAERIIGTCRNKIRDNRRRLCHRLNSGDAKILKDENEYLKFRVEQQKRLIDLYRETIDGILFIYADRFDLKPFVWHQHAGFISGKSGARLERAILRKIFKHGHVAILNDLTQSMRYGDITVFDESGFFTVMEAKSGRGGNFARGQKQQEDLADILEYLYTDRKEAGDGVSMRRIEPAVPPRFHTEILNKLISKSREISWAFDEVENGLYYLVLFAPQAMGPSLEELLKSRLANKKPLVMFSNAYKPIKEAHYPFLLTIEDSQAAYDFYSGVLLITVLVDLDTVKLNLNQRGFSLQITADATFPWKLELNSSFELGVISSVQKDERPIVNIGRHVIDRLAAEFLSLESLLDLTTSGPLIRAAIGSTPPPSCDAAGGTPARSGRRRSGRTPRNP